MLTVGVWQRWNKCWPSVQAVGASDRRRAIGNAPKI